nr:uncharacterized protein LOC115260418 [Aedes albopictus]
MNRTILDRVRSMLNDANLPKRFWAKAVNTAVYLINRSPTRALAGEMTPEEAWTGKKLHLGHLKTFGATAMVHQPKQKRRKLDAKSIKCVFMGYAQDTKGFRVFDPERDSIVISRDVIIVNEERSEFGAQKDPVEFIEIEFPEWIEEAPVRVPDRRLDEPEVASGGSISGGATAPAEPSEGSSSDTDFEDADDNDAIALPPQSFAAIPFCPSCEARLCDRPDGYRNREKSQGSSLRLRISPTKEKREQQ